MSIIFRLCSDQKISLTERGKIVAEANKDKQILFWSSEWQKTQSLKGARKGGLANSVTQFEARSKVGKTFGRQFGLSRQTPKTLERLKGTFCFFRHDKPDIIYQFNPPFRSFADISNILDLLSEQKITRRTCFQKVFNRERLGMYGWKLLKEPLNKNTLDNSTIIDFYDEP